MTFEQVMAAAREGKSFKHPDIPITAFTLIDDTICWWSGFKNSKENLIYNTRYGKEIQKANIALDFLSKLFDDKWEVIEK